MKTILCAGEVLYDFISTSAGAGLAGSTLFEKRPGGSPFNITVGIARLGMPVSFLVKIGTDEFGKALNGLILAEKVDPRFIVRGSGMNTTLAMAALDKSGKPEFHFYRDNAAEISLTEDELPHISPSEICLYQFGSISLADEPASTTYLKVFSDMKEAGVITSFDPNIRPLYVDDKPHYKELVLSLLPKVDILKLSDDDLSWLSGKETIEEGLASLPLNASGIVVVTEGASGARALFNGNSIHVGGFSVTVAETTGCGDSFMAGFIFNLLTHTEGDLSRLNHNMLKECLRFANACAAIVATRFGAANSMPQLHEVTEFLAKRA